MMHANLKIMGARLLSELNDLKRTPDSAAGELGFERSFVQSVIDGTGTRDDALTFISRMGEVYPIDPSDLLLIEDDCTHGIKIMRAEATEASKRVFDRPDKTGNRTPYYEYRDTAMSRLSGFKPEWIKELRVVTNNDPENPDVAFNNGHFMHQLSFHIGPVNFHYEANGRLHVAEFNTGDSNYITPFHKHSFTSRDPDQEAIIIAITFGGEVRRAQKELYALGERAVNGYALPYRDHTRAQTDLILQHIRNANFTPESLAESYTELNLSDLLNPALEKKTEDLAALAAAITVEVNDLSLPVYKPEEDVVTKYKSETLPFYFPEERAAQYEIRPLAATSKMPLMKGFDIEVLPGQEKGEPLENSLHQYVYNYGTAPIAFTWEHDGATHSDILRSGDSAYLQPFIKHWYKNPDAGDAHLVTVGISGAVGLTAQRELSAFPDSKRIARETQRWFS